jgi:energy-coupling factor transport system permease protein
VTRRKRPARQIVLLRMVPGDSPVHRMWAGTKVLVVLAVSVVLTFRPSWSAIGVTALLVILSALAARIPFGALPRVPWQLLAFLVFGAVLTVRAGGAPHVHLGATRIGLGSLEAYGRFIALTTVILGASAMVGWTTPMAEVAPTLVRLGKPLRWLRLPVEEWAVTTALCVRCFPLLLDEFRTVMAVRRLRPRRADDDDLGAARWVAEALDVLGTTIAVSIRRAGELASAIESRGGARLVPRPLRLGLRDLAAALAGAATCAAAFALPS